MGNFDHHPGHFMKIPHFIAESWKKIYGDNVIGIRPTTDTLFTPAQIFPYKNLDRIRQGEDYSDLSAALQNTTVKGHPRISALDYPMMETVLDMIQIRVDPFDGQLYSFCHF